MVTTTFVNDSPVGVLLRLQATATSGRTRCYTQTEAIKVGHSLTIDLGTCGYGETGECDSSAKSASCSKVQVYSAGTGASLTGGNYLDIPSGNRVAVSQLTGAHEMGGISPSKPISIPFSGHGVGPTIPIHNTPFSGHGVGPAIPGMPTKEKEETIVVVVGGVILIGLVVLLARYLHKRK